MKEESNVRVSIALQYVTVPAKPLPCRLLLPISERSTVAVSATALTVAITDVSIATFIIPPLLEVVSVIFMPVLPFTVTPVAPLVLDVIMEVLAPPAPTPKIPSFVILLSTTLACHTSVVSL